MVTTETQSLQKAEGPAGLETREDGVQVLLAEMAAYKFAQHLAIVGCNGEISTFEELVFFEARPLPVHLAAVNRTADHHHEAAVSVIGSAVAVLFHRAAEFGHRYQDNVLHTVAHFLAERSDAGRKLPEKIRKLLILISVVIPPDDISKSHFNAGLCFQQTRELLQIAAEFACPSNQRYTGTGRYRRSGLRRILNRSDHFHGFEGVLAGTAERCVGSRCVHTLHDRRCRLIADIELLQVADRDDFVRAAQAMR